jgi:hypothetical protein
MTGKEKLKIQGGGGSGGGGHFCGYLCFIWFCKLKLFSFPILVVIWIDFGRLGIFERFRLIGIGFAIGHVRIWGAMLWGNSCVGYTCIIFIINLFLPRKRLGLY